MKRIEEIYETTVVEKDEHRKSRNYKSLSPKMKDAVDELFKKTTNEAGEEVMENAIGRELISRLGSEEAAILKITQAKDMLRKEYNKFKVNRKKQNKEK